MYWQRVSCAGSCQEALHFLIEQSRSSRPEVVLLTLTETP